ncbi:hypothetical protein [Streptococcus intermedius]|nr:hypothetical protein [Streptococcus intermedius]
MKFSIIEKLYSIVKNENEKLKKDNKRLASAALRSGSSEGGKYLRNERKN